MRACVSPPPTEYCVFFRFLGYGCIDGRGMILSNRAIKSARV